MRFFLATSRPPAFRGPARTVPASRGRHPAARRLVPGCLLVVGALAAACGDAVGPTGQAEAGPSRTRPWSDTLPHQPPAEEYTFVRTTEAFERDGARLVPRGRRVTVAHAGRRITSVPRGGAAPRVGGREASLDATPDVGSVAAQLPPPGLTVAARRRGVSQSLAWRHRRALAGVPGVEVEVEGVGDAPATTYRFYEHGALARTVTQHYRWRRGRWELARRETTTPDGTLRDVVTVEPVSREEPALSPFVRRPATDEAASFTALAGQTLLDEEACAPCKKEREAKEAAFEAFLWAEGAALLVCTLTPPPADVLACIAAALKVGEAYSKFSKADAAYDACMANPPKCSCNAEPPENFRPDAARVSSDAAFDEECGPGGSPTGGTSEGGGAPPGRQVCHYGVWYEIGTGRIIGVELLYCEVPRVEPIP